MNEHDDVVSVVSVSESSVTVGELTVDETLPEDLGCEGQIGGSISGGEVEKDGGEIMVEVVGSDVFVDGVRGHGGGGDLNSEAGSEGLGKDGLEREITSFDGEGGVICDLASKEVDALGGQEWNDRSEPGVEVVQEIAGSSSEETHVVVAAEETAVLANGDDFERGKELVGGAGDVSGVLTSYEAGVLNEEAQNFRVETGVGGSSVNGGSSHEQTQFVVAEKAVVMVSEEGLDRGLVKEGVERGMENVDDGVDTALDDLTSQKVGVLDDKVRNPEIESAVVCSSPMAESSSIQTQFVEEVDMRVNEEGLNHKGEVLGTDVVEVNLPCSELDPRSAVETICVGMDKDGAVHTNNEFSDQQTEVAAGGEVGVMNEEEILHSKVEVTETDGLDGKLHCSIEDQQMKVERTGERSTKSQHDLGADSVSFPEPTKAIAGGEVAAVDDRFTSNPNVKVPKNVGLGGVGGEVGIVCADSGSSIEQNQIAAGFSVAIDGKVSDPETQVAGGGEVLTSENRLVGAFDENLDYAEDQKLGANTGSGDSKGDVAVCTESESSSEQTLVVNGNEVTVMYCNVSNPKVEVPITDDMGGMASSEDDQNVKGETCGSAGKDGVVHADPESSDGQACVAERAEFAAIDIEDAFNSKYEVPGTDALDGGYSDKDQHLKVEKVEGSSVNDVEHGDLESSGEPIQIAARGDIEATDNEEDVAKMEDGETVFYTSNGNLCLSESDQNLKAETVLGSAEKEGFVQADRGTSAEHILVVKGENASVMEIEKVSISKIDVLDGNTYFQKDENLNSLTMGGSTKKDGVSVAQENAESSGEQTKIDMQVESSVIDCQGIVEVPASALDGNISLSEKNEELKAETVCGSMLEVDVVGKVPSVGADSPPVGDHATCTLGKSSDSFEVNTSVQDEKQETVAQLSATLAREVDGDQNINLLIVDDITNQGACRVALLDTIEVTAGTQTALSCASSYNDGDHVSSCVSDFINCLPDENQTLEVHLVSNDISLPDGDQTMDICVSDVVTSNEVVKQAIEAKDEFCEVDKNYIMSAHVPEAKDSKFNDGSIVGRLVVDLDSCLNRDEKWKSQSDVVRENVSFPDESYCTGVDVKGIEGNLGLRLSESLDDSASGDLCCVGSNVEQEVEVEEQCTDAENVDLHTGQVIEIRKQSNDSEQPKVIDEEISEQATLKPGGFVRVHQASYFLPSENEGEFSVSDLVWGKVRSHPWWPGQIFDPSDASEKAMKYHKKDCFLVAYFGDRTFAWNEASLLKPFQVHFSQIERQSNSEAFHNAVSSALEEVSRRVELGLACSCVPKNVYDRLGSQIVENTGIHQESSRRFGVDKSTGVSSFEPDKLVENIRALAQSPSGRADWLELVIAKAQLLAFSRLKGYSQLPEFQFCGGLMENDADTSQLSEVIEHPTPVEDHEQILSGKGKAKIENSSSHKRKHNLKDSMYPKKKERSLSELMVDVAYSPDGEDGSDGHGKAMSKSVSSSSGKKRKAVDPISDGSVVQDKRISFYAAKVSTTVSPISKPSFKVGECIRRVASQLTGSPSILKCSGSDKQVGFDGLLHENSQKGRLIIPTEYSSLDEMLSQLQLAARDPMKGYSFLITIISFFSGFRNSVILGRNSGRQNSSMGKVGSGRKKKASHAIIGSPEEFEFDDVNDSYWTDRIIQNNSEEEPSSNSQYKEEEYQLVAFEPDKPSRRSYSRKRFSNGNHEMTIEEPNGHIDVRKQNAPTELILNFTEGESVPSETSLNKIFKRFGPLKESETEVDRETSRARVVFKKCSDAEVAFNSAGKFNIFGPTLVNYQISYSPSISFKTLPLATSLAQDDAI